MTNAETILKRLLIQIAEEQNFDKYDLKIEPISSGGANYTSTLYNVTITEGNNVTHMFAKIAAIGDKFRSQSPKFYRTEAIAYTQLLKVYERLQEEQNVPVEHRLVFPKFYGCNPTEREETIVLENLVLNGYEAYDRFKSIDWPYAKSVLTELGKMHALSIAYSEYLPEEFNKIVGELKFEWDSESDAMQQYFNSITSRAIRYTREENKDKLKRFFDVIGPAEFLDFCKCIKRPVIGHGDFRPSNLMHRIRDDGTLDIKIVDLQTLHGGSPIIDLLFFIFTGSDEEFRSKYYEKSVDHYYTQLHAAMKRLNLDPEKVYSREDFDYELKKKLAFGLTIAVFTLPVITVDAENAPKVNEDMDLKDFSVENTSDLYLERLNGVVNDYVKWGVLQ